ncbi:MAG: trypsin-like peptidase domain-containing protein [Dehalococcoidia bacterium]
MFTKTKYILAAVILVTITLSVSIWALSPPPTSSPPQLENSTPHTDPDWTFPDSEPATPLPDFPPVIASTMPSVVSVTTEMVVSSFFRQYTEHAAGSGIIIDDKGYIVTNNHVVENAQSIYVELHDDRTFPASMVGSDPLSDLAVIKIDAADLSYAGWGDSSSLLLGQWVIAIGNALGEGIIATEGIVSRLDVTVSIEGNILYDLIQTTAAINPGNSGGPLVNMAGEVIGITSVKIVAAGVEGMGFAISSDQAKLIIPDLIRHGRVTYPWLGVGLYTVDPSLAAALDLSVERGALIVELVADSPADDAGLRKDDIIIRFGGQEISNVADLVRAIRASEVGEEVEIVFVRGEDTRTTSTRLIERPTP